MNEKPSCLDCKHFDWNKGNACVAFLDEIPFEIKNGDIGHNKVIEEQKNDIVFEKNKVTGGWKK